MKNKILKTLEKHHIILPILLAVAMVVGFFIVKYVGQAPKGNFNLNTTNNEVLNNAVSNGEEMTLAFPKSGRVDKINVKVGDAVKKGDTLASLDSEDTLGALQIAKANYEKIINGATGPDIDVAKSAVNTALVNLENVKSQQNLAVKTAYRNLLNSTPEVLPKDNSQDYIAPTISGTYNLDKEGQIVIHVYQSAGGDSFIVSGLTDGTGIVNESNAQPVGDSGLYIKFPSNVTIGENDWVINIPNVKASNYLANNNAYQSAVETKERLITTAQATLDQANSALLLKQSNARPEDVSAALGSLKVAEGAYNNNFIFAPADGVVSSVNIDEGEIAIMNQKAISIIVNKQ